MVVRGPPPFSLLIHLWCLCGAPESAMVVRGPPPFSLLIHLAFVVSLWSTSLHLAHWLLSQPSRATALLMIIATRVKNVCLLNHSVLSGRLSSHMIAITTFFANNFVCHDSWIDHLRRTKALSAPPADILNLYLFGKKMQPNRHQCKFRVSWM